jgi:hypothetical protein
MSDANAVATAQQATQIVNTAWPIISPYIIAGLTFVVGWFMKQPWKMIGGGK